MNSAMDKECFEYLLDIFYFQLRATPILRLGLALLRKFMFSRLKGA